MAYRFVSITLFYLFLRSHIKKLSPSDWLSLAVLRFSENLNKSINVVTFMFVVMHV